MVWNLKHQIFNNQNGTILRCVLKGNVVWRFYYSSWSQVFENGSNARVAQSPSWAGGNHINEVRVGNGYIKLLTKNGAPGKIYKLSGYDEGRKIIHLVPCYRKQDNKPGVYDIVTKQFLTNGGSDADFGLGPDIN